MHACVSCCCPQAGDSPLQLGPKAEESGKVKGNPLSFLLRLLLGTAAGFYYFLVSVDGWVGCVWQGGWQGKARCVWQSVCGRVAGLFGVTVQAVFQDRGQMKTLKPAMCGCCQGGSAHAVSVCGNSQATARP